MILTSQYHMHNLPEKNQTYVRVINTYSGGNNVMQKTNSQPASSQMTPVLNHGGHELFECHEILAHFIGLLDQYALFDGFIQEQELKNILHRQQQYITDLYNISVEAFMTGSKPSHPTQTYLMNQDHQVVYGLQKQSTPKKPITSSKEIKDAGISDYMLGLVKSVASMLATTSLEITNPVIRRMMADSIPNFIEMGYEIFLYQNKRQFYQVPQLPEQDMKQMLNNFAPIH
jgi:spore coat protein CotF